MKIQHFYDKDTATFTYVLSDDDTKKCAIIDSVMGYDIFSGKTSNAPADLVIDYVTKQNLKVEWILETHAHADHLTASNYIKEKLGGKIAIGENIKEVIKFWAPIFNTTKDTPLDGSQFDHLFKDGEKFAIGNLEVTAMFTPGHTPACVSYLVEDCVFVGDTIFTPKMGTARTDFPGGSAKTLYCSIQKLLSLPNETKIFVGHDYPEEGEGPQFLCTVLDQKKNNILINESVSEAQYVEVRNKRDVGKAVPKLLLPSIQVNIRAGKFGSAEDNAVKYIKIPLNKI
jgi:glyoxylase-like metal-dependent hydrolase (beta-lactamase superfamily II)